MASNLESDFPPSPQNGESGDEDHDFPEDNKIFPKDTKINKSSNNNVTDLLSRLKASGALLTKPKKEHRCVTCDVDYVNWEELESHLLEHVSLPRVLLDKLPSDDEDAPPSGDENWTDEEEEAPPPPPKTPQKLDISQIMQKTGLSIKKSKPTEANAALNKLSGLGITLKKGTTPIKQEKPETEQNEKSKENSSNIIDKLGKLGGLKLKLKSDGAHTNSFKVVDGLKNFQTSDDEEEDNHEEQDMELEEEIKTEKNYGGERENPASDEEHESAEENNIDEYDKEKDDDSDETGVPLADKKIRNALNNLRIKQKGKVHAKEIPKPNCKEQVNTKEKFKKEKEEEQPEEAPPPAPKPPGRRGIKQTPKRGANLPSQARKELQAQASPTQSSNVSTTSTPERRESHDSNNSNTERVVVKQEPETPDSQTQNSTVPLFSGQIKTERSSPPPANTITSTPIISSVKTEPESVPVSSSSQPLFQNSSSSGTASNSLLPVKTEAPGMTIIEINGDSGDDDDDCCVVSATPAPDVKPVIPKTEEVQSSYNTSYPSSQQNYHSSSRLTPSTEKQHSFNWNAPDSKPSFDLLDKNADDALFDSLISAKKESLSDAGEYISLDTLGPNHNCEVCNTRFTTLSLLEEHKRITGHSTSLVLSAPSSSTILPYSSSSNLFSTLLPVKQLAEQVGKLSGIGSGPGFTHQQNVMINIQAYPGQGGVMPPPSQPYNAYAPGQGVSSGYGVSANSMYGGSPQAMPPQYSGQGYMGPAGYPQQQFQPAMSMPQTMYSTASPLQGMQQAVYGQSPMNTSTGMMGPPTSTPYIPSSSPSSMMRPPSSGSSVRIQNVQTIAPGQTIGKIISGPDMAAPGQPPPTQMPSPGPIRMAAGANITGARPRISSVRGTRPSVRPGLQVHGQVRGSKPGVRMPMKRPVPGQGPGTPAKRRPDMLLPGKHDNEDCQVMAMQKQRDGMPMIHSVQGAEDKLKLGSQISITKKPAPNKEANAMASVLASRGISINKKQKSRTPSPERPVPHIPNLGAGVSIKHTSKSSNFTIPEAKVGGGMLSCSICKKMFMNQNSLSVHMSNAHPNSKSQMFKCDECPASYPKSLQLQHHKRVFHNVVGPNRELGLPVVDLSQEDTLTRLSNLGIYSFIPLANREQSDGCFGVPVISVHNMRNGITSGLHALGAEGLLSLGPLKPLPNS